MGAHRVSIRWKGQKRRGVRRNEIKGQHECELEFVHFRTKQTPLKCVGRFQKGQSTIDVIKNGVPYRLNDNEMNVIWRMCLYTMNIFIYLFLFLGWERIGSRWLSSEGGSYHGYQSHAAFSVISVYYPTLSFWVFKKNVVTNEKI